MPRQVLVGGVGAVLVGVGLVAAASGSASGQASDPDQKTLSAQFLGTFEGQTSEQQIDPLISTNQVKITYTRTYFFTLTTEPLGDVHWKIHIAHRVKQEGTRMMPFAVSSQSVVDFDCDLVGKSEIDPVTSENFLPMFEMGTIDDKKNAINEGSNIRYAPLNAQCQSFRNWWAREHGLQRFRFTTRGEVQATMDSPMRIDGTQTNTLTWTLTRQAPSSTGSASSSVGDAGASSRTTRDCAAPTTACSDGCSTTQQQCSARLSPKSSTYIRDNSKCVNDLYTCVARCSSPYYQCLSTASDEPLCHQTLYGCLAKNPGGMASAGYEHGCFDSFRQCH